MGGQAFAVRSLDAGATGDEEGRTAEWLGQIPVWCAPGTRWRVRLCHWPFKTYRAALTVGRKQPADVRSRASPVPRERVAGKWHLCGPYAPEAGPNRAEAGPDRGLDPARETASLRGQAPGDAAPINCSWSIASQSARPIAITLSSSRSVVSARSGMATPSRMTANRAQPSGICSSPVERPMAGDPASRWASISKASIAIPHGFTAAEFWPLGIAGKGWPFHASCDNVLAVSPFLGADPVVLQ